MSVASRRARWGFLIACPLIFFALGRLIDTGRLFPRLRIAVQRPAGAFPSTMVIPEVEILHGVPLLSVYVDRLDLYDPERGLLANRHETGREWERPASMSYFDKGRLLFATGAGIRIHGGGDRLLREKQSFRLYFRRQYGVDRFRRDLLFDATTEPLSRLVLDRDEQTELGTVWHFINPLAYDIARRIGSVTVQTKPVRLFLNGESQGVYVVSEHLSDEFFRSRFGHADFSQGSRAEEEVDAWLKQRRRLTMATVADVIDLDNLTRWFLSALFCATFDSLQRAPTRDLRDPTARVFWINWDMDGSFASRKDDTLPWDFNGFEEILESTEVPPRRATEFRPWLLSALLVDNKAYRTYFKRIFVEVMNHRLTPNFLTERFEYYREIFVA